MAKDRIISSIDIGSSKVCALVSTISEEKVSIIGVSSIPSTGIKKGIVVDIDEAVEAIAQSLEGAERMAGIAVNNALVTIAGSHIESMNSHGVVAVSHQDTEITEQDVIRVTEAAQAVSFPNSREIIHVIPRDFVVDSQEGIKDPVGMSGVRLEVETNIISGSATSMRNIVRCVSQVGVDVEDLVFVGTASSESTLTDTEKELGTMLADIGGGTTSLIMFTEGSPQYSSVLPIGGQHITNDLAIGLRTSTENAEKIKLLLSLDEKKSRNLINEEILSASGEDAEFKIKKNEIDISSLGLEIKSVPKRLLFDIIDSRLREIFSLVALEIKKANLTGKLPSGVVVTGGAAETIGLKNIAKAILKMPVRIGYPKGVTGLIDEIGTPAYSAAIGSIIYGSKLTKSDQRLGRSISGRVRGIPGKILDLLKSFMP